MTRFLLRRLVWSLVTLFLFQTLVFFIVQSMIPGDFASGLRIFLTGEEVDAIRSDLGLDLPLWRQYLGWLGKLFTGSLGTSFGGGAVLVAIGRVLPPTLVVFVTGTVVAFAAGQWLGRVAGWRDGVVSHLATSSAVLLYTAFPPWLAFLVASVAGGGALRVGTTSFVRPGQVFTAPPPGDLGAMWLLSATLLAVLVLVGMLPWLYRWFTRSRLRPAWLTVAGAAMLAGSWWALGIFGPAVDVLSAALLPIVTFILLTFGEITLIMQSGMLGTRYEYFVQAARAKGLSERAVRNRHAGRLAVLPVLSRFVISLPYLLTGLVIIETAFGWEGLSAVLFGALQAQDMPVVLGGLLVVGVLSVFVRLALDVLQVVLDPRLREPAA